MRESFGYYCSSCKAHWSTWKRFRELLLSVGLMPVHRDGAYPCPHCKAREVRLQNYLVMR